MSPDTQSPRAIGPFPGLQIVPPADSDLVSIPVALPQPGSHHLTYHGGPTLKHPEIVLVEFGPFWGDAAKLERHTKMLVENGYLSGLTNYGSGNGTYRGAVRTAATWDGGTILDSDVQKALERLIADHTLPAPNANTMYVCIMPPNVAVKFDGDTAVSCQQFCGFHHMYSRADGTSVYYGVETTTQCDGCNQGDAYKGFTMVLGHEIAECATDPAGNGFFEDSTGMENADICAWNESDWGPDGDKIAVQPYWTNEGNSTIGAYVPDAVPQPKPPPPPPPPPKPKHHKRFHFFSGVVTGIDTDPYWPWLLNAAAWAAENKSVIELNQILDTAQAFFGDAVDEVTP